MKIYFALLSVFMLTACTGTYRTHYNTIKFLFAPAPDVAPTLEELERAEADFAFVKSGDRDLARVALAFAENGQYKWISRDNALLIEQDGHIVKTLGFQNDLIYVSNLNENPLRVFRSLGSDARWERSIDWESGEFGYLIRSNFEKTDSVSITIMDEQFDATLIIENAEYKNPSKGIKLSKSWQNMFWYDTETGILLKSSQKLSPFSERFEIEYISRAFRLKNPSV